MVPFKQKKCLQHFTVIFQGSTDNFLVLEGRGNKTILFWLRLEHLKLSVGEQTADKSLVLKHNYFGFSKGLKRTVGRNPFGTQQQPTTPDKSKIDEKIKAERKKICSKAKNGRVPAFSNKRDGSALSQITVWEKTWRLSPKSVLWSWWRGDGVVEEEERDPQGQSCLAAPSL